METTHRPRSGASQGKLVAAGLFAILVIAAIVWWTTAQELPVIKIPTPTLPNPNAFDTYNSAAAQLLDSSKIGYAISSRHAASVKDDRDYSWAEKEKLISENAPALDLLREGLNETYVNPPARSFNALFPYYAQHRAMARLLALESAVRAHRGDFAGAAGSALDAVELGEEIPRGSTLIGGLVGIACQAIGRRSLLRYTDRLSGSQALAAAKRMERIRAKHVPFHETLQEEEWAGQAGLLEIMRKPNSMAAMNQAMGSPAPSLVNNPYVSQLAYLVYSKRRIMNDYTKYMDSEIARAKLPYGTAPATKIPNDPIVQILVPVFGEARLSFVKSEAQNGLTEISLALRAYRVQHGSYPESLSALAPAMLVQLPADPFGKGGTFGYRRVGSVYVLYSVGPDGKDDGGAPIDTGKAMSTNPNERYFVKPDSKGDIVAGKNIY